LPIASLGIAPTRKTSLDIYNNDFFNRGCYVNSAARGNFTALLNAYIGRAAIK